MSRLAATIAGHARTAPSDRAIGFEDERIDFAELDRRVGQRARTLLDTGIM